MKETEVWFDSEERRRTVREGDFIVRDVGVGKNRKPNLEGEQNKKFP